MVPGHNLPDWSGAGVVFDVLIVPGFAMIPCINKLLLPKSRTPVPFVKSPFTKISPPVTLGAVVLVTLATKLL